MTRDNYELKGIKAHYFTGPFSSSENGFRTVPTLLRKLADWMEENDVQDPEFEELKLKTTFVEDSAAEEFYETATIYYRDNGNNHAL